MGFFAMVSLSLVLSDLHVLRSNLVKLDPRLTSTKIMRVGILKYITNSKYKASTSKNFSKFAVMQVVPLRAHVRAPRQKRVRVLDHDDPCAGQSMCWTAPAVRQNSTAVLNLVA